MSIPSRPRSVAGILNDLIARVRTLEALPTEGASIDFCSAISQTAVVSTATDADIGYDDDIAFNTNPSLFTYDATNDAINLNGYGVFVYSCDVSIVTVGGGVDDSPTEAFLFPVVLDAAAAGTGAYYWPKIVQPRLPSSINAEVGAYISPDGENGDYPRSQMIVSLQDDGFTTLPFKLKAHIITNAPTGNYSRILTGSVYRLGDAAV